MLREEAQLTLEELAGRTKIPVHYLRRLEREEYEKLPPPVYIRGFLQRWANVTGGDAEALMQQFHRENRFFVHASKTHEPGPIAAPRFVLTLRHVVIAASSLLALSLIGFFYYTQFVTSQAPRVEITDPVEVSSVSSRQLVDIEGETEAVESMAINGQEVRLQQDGSFSHAYELQRGTNTISIIARNGSEQVEVVRTIVYVGGDNS